MTTSGGPARVVFLLGGQGSQYFGMARSLMVGAPAFAERMRTLDRVARQVSGRSVLEYLYGPPQRSMSDPCDDLELSSLALVMVQVSLVRELAVRGIRPDWLVGSSLGELTSFAVAGWCDADTVMEWFATLARLATSHLPAGGMLAVLDSVDEARALPEVRRLEVVALNHDRHFVLAGERAAVDAAEAALGARGMLTARLPVHVGFHCASVDPVARPVRLCAEELCARVEAPRHGPRVISSVTARELSVDELDAEHLWQVVRSPMRFAEAVDAIPVDASTLLVDLSPSGTQSAVLRQARPHLRCAAVVTMFHREMEALDALAPHQDVSQPPVPTPTTWRNR